MAMASTKTFSGRELEDPEKHVKRFKLNLLAKKLPLATVDQLQARFGYFSETLTDAASEWFDALVLANIPDMQTLYTQFQARFAFNVTDQWPENQVFRQTKQRPAEPSTDFIRRIEAEGVRIKATAADDTILQGLLPAILNSVMQHELGDGLEDIRKWAKIADRYSTNTDKSGQDIAEIKSKLNDLATQLNKTQVSAVTPERRTVQFTDTTLTRTHPREPSTAAPIQNYDPFTGQRLHYTPIYDVTTGERLQSSITSRQRQESSDDRPTPRNRSPSPPYNNTGRKNSTHNNSGDYNRPSSSQRESNQGHSRREYTPQYNSIDYNRSSSLRREPIQQRQYDNTRNKRNVQS